MSNSIRQLVEAQVAEKIAKGEALAELVEAVHVAQAAFEQAQKDAASARREALTAGWTESELRRVGLAGPTAPRPRRRRVLSEDDE